MRSLHGVRDRVLKNSGLKSGHTLLDVGTGDGLIAFGAIDIVGPNGVVIFSDISQDLLDVCMENAAAIGVAERCRFLTASANDLSMLHSESVDAVTTRSVLIYVKDKQAAFEEFVRVLRPGGRLSLFEPINVFASRPGDGSFWGVDVKPIAEIAGKVRAVYESIQGPDDPMLDFDERDLLKLAQNAGFREVHLEYEANLTLSEPRNWDVDIHRSPNPLVPTLAEAMSQVLDKQEAVEFTKYMRPLFESGGLPRREAVAYLWAVKL